MQEHSYAVGSYDWLAQWRRMYDRERAQAEAVTEPGFGANQDFWANQAERFAAAAARAPQPDGFMRFLLPRLRPGDHLLDIGAGTGRYIPILEQHVAQVIALEPSAAMRTYLQQRCQPETIIITEPWPEADVPACDVCISAHVIYSVREIGPFLQRIDTITRRAAYLLLAIQHPMSYIHPFWEAQYGEPRLPLPGALECLNVLYQLGIHANLTCVPIDSRLSFANEAEALNDIRWRLRLLPETDRDQRIRAIIPKFLERADDGVFYPRGLPTEAAVLWWEHGS